MIEIVKLAIGMISILSIAVALFASESDLWIIQAWAWVVRVLALISFSWGLGHMILWVFR